MNGVNKVTIIGNVCNDLEVRLTNDNVKMLKFKVATSVTFKTKEGEYKEDTEFHRVVLWKSLAEAAEKILAKGDLVYIEGRLKTRKVEDENKVSQSVTEVIVDLFQKI